jgi:tRNA(fMet)-specific endonuclease VapC
MKYLLDTNVFSELVVKQPNTRVIDWIDSVDPNSLYLSVITIGELRKGIEKLPKSKRKTNLLEWLNDQLQLRFRGRILAIDIDVMLAWGILMGQLEQVGRPLPAMDSLIAASALHHNCSLVTRNEDDFKKTGVVLMNPWV